jgi:hypothetical protein
LSQHRKHRGYATQRLVAQYLAAHGWPYAESTGAGRTGTDITGTPGIDWEVKARRNLNLIALIDQMRERQVPFSIPIAVVRPDGRGPATIDDWPAILPLSDLCDLLREAGYGNPTTT